MEETRTTALVVEDDVDVATLLGSHLTRMGWLVEHALTAEDALRRAAAQTPDVAVVDLLLPGMPGRELVRRLRAGSRTRTCRIVVTSVLDRDELVAIGADAVLPKPFSRKDVHHVMTQVRAGRTAQ